MLYLSVDKKFIIYESSMLNIFFILFSIVCDFKMSISDWFEFTQKNKPQGNSLVGGILVLAVAGLQNGWIYNSQLHHFKWAENHSTFQIVSTYVGFYITAIAGLYMAMLIIDRLSKRDIYVRISKKFLKKFA